MGAKCRDVVAVKADDVQEFIDVLSDRLIQTMSRIKATEKHLGKVHKRTDLMLKGYERRREKLIEEISSEFDRLSAAKTKLTCFSRLRDIEVEAAPLRIAEYEKLIHQEEDREAQLQARYHTAVDS